MSKHFFLASGRGAVATAAAAVALAFGQVAAQTDAARGDEYPFGSDIQGFSADGTQEEGTILAERPGLPQQEARGALGPLRWEQLRPYRTDPSIRDTNPLTMNGPWEQQFGNVVTHPGGMPTTGR